jgi:hypothetical protein
MPGDSAAEADVKRSRTTEVVEKTKTNGIR